jgi:hypothetical protein
MSTRKVPSRCAKTEDAPCLKVTFEIIHASVLYIADGGNAKVLLPSTLGTNGERAIKQCCNYECMQVLTSQELNECVEAVELDSIWPTTGAVRLIDRAGAASVKPVAESPDKGQDGLRDTACR